LKVYDVIHREILITTYRVEAEDEEDAFEAVQAGDGEVVDKDTESAADDDEDQWVATEVEDEDELRRALPPWGPRGARRCDSGM